VYVFTVFMLILPIFSIFYVIGIVMTSAAGSADRGEALGQSEAFLDFQEQLSRVAPVDRPVLLIGERGTGKELAASRLHYLSRRWQSVFITLNCAALTPSLIESELFGHERGAFTGAQQRRVGRFEAADHGTLFLDEIGAIPTEVQEKILRVVEYGIFERVGSAAPIEVDVRIIGATNVDLRTMVKEGRFKQDLLDRLAFEVLYLPPLRARQEDIMLLANHFAGCMALELGRETMPTFSRSALKAMEQYPWPGNIRELKNVVERSVYRSQDDRIGDIRFDPFEACVLPAAPAPPATSDPPASPTTAPLSPLPLKSAVEQLQLHRLREALQLTQFNQRKAAARLGLTYDQLRGLMRKFTDQLKT
jgi:psp operon transcriptional activator